MLKGLLSVNRLYKEAIAISAILFPGAFRFIVVWLFTTILNGHHELTMFSEGFFWVVFFTSLTAIPITGIMSNRHFNVSLIKSSILCLVILILAIFTVHQLTPDSLMHAYSFNIFLGSICLILFEICRKHFLNHEAYNSLTFAGASSFLIVLIYLANDPQNLLAAFFASMALPVCLLLMLEKRNSDEKLFIDNKSLLKEFFRFFIASALVTALMSGIPILLAWDLGANSSVDLVQVFSVSSMLLIFPRLLSTKNIPLLRQNGSKRSLTLSFFNRLRIYCLVVCVISCSGIYLHYTENGVLYCLFVIGMQTSQLVLPFSNVLTVEGKSAEFLKINVISGSLFFLLVIISISIGQLISMTVLLAYIFSNILRLVWSYRVCEKEYVKE